MDFCQAVFNNDEYKYFLEDSPCPHVGLVGCDDITRSAIIGALAGIHYRPARLRVSSHETIATVYRKKDTIGNKNLDGVVKLGWWKKHQEKVLGCAVVLLDWDSIKVADRVAFEAYVQRSLDVAKAYLKVPYASNTKIIVGLVCNARSLSDPSPCGFYLSIEEAQSSLRSRLGLSDRNILALYQRGMDQYSVQRLENMIMEQTGKYHREEINRLRKAKGEANEAAAAVATQMSHAEGDAVATTSGAQELNATTAAMEAVLIARNRFKIAWHATVVKETKLARRSWEKCYNALHSLPPPLSVDRWVIATITLWKLIADNFQKYNQPQSLPAKEVAAASFQIETDVQAFLIHLNWVVDHSFVFHGGAGDTRLAPRPYEPTQLVVLGRLSEAEALQVLVREWYLADFYTLMANRLEALKEFLPKPGDNLEARVICLPAYHQYNASKSLWRIRDLMCAQLTMLKGRDGNVAPGLITVDRVKPEAQPTFIGKEYADQRFLAPFLTTLSLVDVTGRIRSNILNAIVCYQAFGLAQLTATMQLEIAENDIFIGHYGDALGRLNRLLKDPLLTRWGDITLAVHEHRCKASTAIMRSDTISAGGAADALASSSHSRVGSSPSGSDSFYATPTGALACHRGMLLSLLYMLLHCNTSQAQTFREELKEVMGRYKLEESAARVVRQLEGDGTDSVGSAFVDITPITMAERVEGSSSTGSIRALKGRKLCQATADSATIFPLLRIYTHFTKPYVESWKGATADHNSPSNRCRMSSGLTISIECNATTPLRLYNVEFHLYQVLPQQPGEGRRKRVRLPQRVRLCWFGDDKPTHFIEVSSKAPVWSTTIYSLPFLPDLEAGTYECGSITASVFVSNTNVTSTRAVVGFDNGVGSDTYDSTARRRSSPSVDGANASFSGSKTGLGSRLMDKTGHRSVYHALPPAAGDATFASVPIFYNFSAAIENDYVALFEDFCFDTSESKTHLFLTSQLNEGHHQRSASVIHGGSKAPLSRGQKLQRATSFAYPINGNAVSSRIDQKAVASEVSKLSTGSNTSLAAFANILLLEGHRFGGGSAPGCYGSHLHRPVIRLTKPVAQLTIEAAVPAGQHVVEGDDYVVPLVLESKGDLLLKGRLLIPYLEDVVDIVEATGEDGTVLDMADVTHDSPAIDDATPVGYRIAEIVMKPKAIEPSGPRRRLVINLRLRCSYAGLFEMPIRLDYATPKCDTMLLMHMLRVHVCRPFLSNFKVYDLHALNSKGGEERVLGAADVAVPDMTAPSYPCRVGGTPSASVGGCTPAADGFDPFAADAAVTTPNALPKGVSDELVSEFMSIWYSERQDLMSLGRMAEVQKAFDRDARMANVVVNAAAQRLLKAQEAAGVSRSLLSGAANARGSVVLGARKDGSANIRVNNQFYHVDRVLTSGQGLQVTPDKFQLRLNTPFVVRACFVNTMRCPVSVDRVDVQLADGVSAAFATHAPSVQTLLPGEELTFVLHVRCAKAFNVDDSIGRLAVHIHRVNSVPHRGIGPSISALCGGGHPLRFYYTFPRVPVVEQLHSAISNYPTTVFVGEPFPLKVTVTNTSAVPSRKLRLHFSGASLDKYFHLTGRTQTNFVVPGFGTTTVTVSLTPLVAGAFNLPCYELTSDDAVYARSQDLHTIEVLPILARK